MTDKKEIEMFKEKVLDLLERSGWTFVQAFLATLLVTGVLDTTAFDLDAWKIALAAAAIAAIKAVIAQQFGTGTAATLPAETEPVYPANADQEWAVADDEDIAALDEIAEGPPA